MAKSDEAREQLASAADTLFFERGYNHVNVADICKAAGRAKGLFFYYFEKKESVVKLLAERQIQAFSSEMEVRLEQMPLSAIEKMNFMMNALISRDSTGPRAMYYFKDGGIPDWFDAMTHELKDRYVFPLINGIVKEIAEETGNINFDEQVTELVYIGISGFVHRNFNQMEQTAYYKKAVRAIGYVLETVLKCPAGTMNIQ